MEVKPRALRRYVKDDGRVPFGEWMDALRDVRVRAIIAKRLTRVALGNFGDHKAVGGGVMELRFDIGPGYRIYFAEQGSTIVLLLNGGDKSTQAQDIATARGFWAHWKEKNDGQL
ncbi:MAG: type II toxin-antitoxin system RelE/ParE family toxin [Myxococcales bacterium]|nr:type II toxin-antitoxin system RelE/ParE family toxin [Myxococcales bacterium]